MWVHMSVHHPKPGKKDALIESMHRFGAAIRNAPGLVSVQTLYDADQDVLIGMAIWESQEAFQASVHLARAAVANDPFDEWEAEDVTGFRAQEV
jgi:heme-degrading monooxygenase HmoA